MNDINLLRYHNRSAGEIHMLLNAESADEFFSRVVLGEYEERVGRSKLALIITLILSLACASFASYVIYNVYIVKTMSFPFLDKQKIIAKVEEYKLDLRTGGDQYLKDGFEKIAIVTTVPDEQEAKHVVVESEYKVPIDVEKRPDLFIKPVELKGEPEKRKRDKRVLVTPMFTGNYALQFLDINESDFSKVKVLAENNDFNMSVIGSVKRPTVKWKVYKRSKKSSTVILGQNVAYVKTFRNKSDAVSYLQKNKIAGLVTSDTTYYDYYDIEVCCLGEEAAQKMAHGSGVSMDKIKILKK